jgi:hypothetical protein
MFWIREILGWLLVLAGLYVFYIAMQLLLRDGPFILEAPLFVAIGFFVFRGGLQLIKMSVAGRVCLDAQKAALETGRNQLPAGMPRRGQTRQPRATPWEEQPLGVLKP